MTGVSGRTELLLAGLEGGNPLAFLAAVGVLRVVTLTHPEWVPTMTWRQARGGYRPVLTLAGPLETGQFLEDLGRDLAALIPAEAFVRWDNLGVPLGEYRAYALDAAAAAERGNRAWADFAAAFASEVVASRGAKKDAVEDTAFRTLSGSGHQHFLATMRNLIEATTADQLRRALLLPWDYADPMPNSTLRWDPADDIRHALQWRNPSKDPSRKIGGTMAGATRLAIEALPLMPSVPVGARLDTTGFRGRGRRDTFFTWPLWDGPIGLDTCRSVLAMAELQEERPSTGVLRERGILAVFRSQRITEGKYRNFTPARRVA